MNLPLETLERWMRLQDRHCFAELSQEMYQMWLEEIRKPGAVTGREQPNDVGAVALKDAEKALLAAISWK